MEGDHSPVGKRGKETGNAIQSDKYTARNMQRTFRKSPNQDLEVEAEVSAKSWGWGQAPWGVASSFRWLWFIV